VAAVSRGARRASQSGQAVIELALTLPLLLVIVMGILDFGLMFQSYEVVTNAAREGARVGVLPNYTTADAEARAQQYLASGGLSSSSATVTAVVAPSPPFGSPAVTVNQVQVSVMYPYTYPFVGPMLNLFGGSLGSVQLTATSTMRVEGN
jgi:Flp pilus assembly protein TadG